MKERKKRSLVSKSVAGAGMTGKGKSKARKRKRVDVVRLVSEQQSFWCCRAGNINSDHEQT